jgi:arylsulfatase A-like enzyme
MLTSTDDMKPNIVYLLADQLRASSLPIYGEKQIDTPNIDQLAKEGTIFTNAISSCPLCTPYRSMFLTGRHPQTTGHIINFMKTRHDEISIADAFSSEGFRTGWVGKWHLHTGSFPQFDGPDYVPEGRDRLGFDYWRGYNYHTTYFDGPIATNQWHYERWQGYETEGLLHYVSEFLDSSKDSPFCLFISPHQPHRTHTPWETPQFAPEKFYQQLPDKITLPVNVPEEAYQEAVQAYRHYLAMILAIDEMLGNLMAEIFRRGLQRNTILVFGSDHGTMMGAKGFDPWRKRVPYEESILVPLVARWPGNIPSDTKSDILVSPVDIFPTLCGLCDIPIPSTVEGWDLSQGWQGAYLEVARSGILTMNFTNIFPSRGPNNPDHLVNGGEWRGLRTKQFNYARWLDGKVELYDTLHDPLQEQDLSKSERHFGVLEKLEKEMIELMDGLDDELQPCTEYKTWFDNYRRIVRNAHGSLGDPEKHPVFLVNHSSGKLDNSNLTS